MECLKCGRETIGKEVFCGECLKGMDKSPVSPNTHVVIHPRPEPSHKAPQKKVLKSDEIVANLNRKLRWLQIALAVMTLLFVVASGVAGYFIWADLNDADTGFNYSTITYPSEGGSR